MRVVTRISLVLALALSACGGTSQSSATPEPALTSAAPSASAEPAEPKAEDSVGTGDQEVMAERRATFTATCNADGTKEAFCGCTWDKILEVVPREAVLEDHLLPEQLEEVKRLSLLHCVGDISEQDVQKAFHSGCMSKANEGFCSCSYRELRKEASVREIATRGGEDPEGFAAKRKTATDACATQLAEASVKASFLKGCRDAGGSEASCGCAWDYVSSRVSFVDIALDNVDVAKLGPGLRQHCAQSAP